MFSAIIIVCLLTGRLRCFSLLLFWFLLLFAVVRLPYFQFRSVHKPLRGFHQMSEWEISLGRISKLFRSTFFFISYIFMNNTHILCKTNTFHERRRMKHIASSCSANEWFKFIHIFRTKYTHFLCMLCVYRFSVLGICHSKARLLFSLCFCLWSFGNASNWLRARTSHRSANEQIATHTHKYFAWKTQTFTLITFRSVECQ